MDIPFLSHRITPGNAWLIRTDAQGTVLWEREYGGEKEASFSSIIQVGQEEYVLLGEIAASYERDEADLYLVKVDGQGNEIWLQTFGWPSHRLRPRLRSPQQRWKDSDDRVG